MANDGNNVNLYELPDGYRTKGTLPIEIEEPLEDVITEANTHAVFECKVKGFPAPTCFWYKDGKAITSTKKMKITVNGRWHRLEVASVTDDDHGVYTAIFKNKSSVASSEANLYIGPEENHKHDGVLYLQTCNATPKSLNITKQLVNVNVQVDDKIDLYISLQSEAEDYLWFKSNKPLHSNARMTIIKKKSSSKLHIDKAETTDTGIYLVIAKTKHGVASSFADVHVVDFDPKMLTNSYIVPYIEEPFVEEIEANENEDVRLICKAKFYLQTKIKWFKNRILIENDDRLVAEDYGNQCIGLRIVEPTRSDTGEFSVLLHDEDTGHMETSSCFLSVIASPMKSPPVVQLRKPVDSVIACVGSKVYLDCSFCLEDPRYFFVVWYVGHCRVERTNSRFNVVCKGGDFLLHIKKLEPCMSGEVICELRRALPNQRSVLINSIASNLTVVPPSVVEEEVRTRTLRGRRYHEVHSKRSPRICPKANPEHNRFSWLSDSSPSFTNGNSHIAKFVHNEVIFEIQYCRLEDDSFYYLNTILSDEASSRTRLVVYDKPQKTRVPRREQHKYVVMEWDDSTQPPNTWYAIELGQPDGSYIQAGLSSVSMFEMRDPPVGRTIYFRVKALDPLDDCSESTICIIPASEEKKPSKVSELKPMEKFDVTFTKTGNIIGSGAFGSVVLVHDANGDHYAAKVLKTRTQKKRDTALREYELMKNLRHPKLVELNDAFTAKDSFILIMDYLWGGELFDRIVDEEHIKEVDVVPYVRQICEALEYLNTQKIAHLDLKPENIVCLNPNSRQVKIIDFGLARILDEGHATRAIYGTRDYVAPEVLNFEQLTLACDMWSLGVVTYMLLSGVMPFAGDTWPERSANITLANYNYDESAFKEISDLAKDFVDQLLVIPADKRMTASEALNHRWIVEGPPKGIKAGHMKRARENLKSYLANYRARWQRAGNVMIAAHRLRTQLGNRSGLGAEPTLHQTKAT